MTTPVLIDGDYWIDGDYSRGAYHGGCYFVISTLVCLELGTYYPPIAWDDFPLDVVDRFRQQLVAGLTFDVVPVEREPLLPHLQLSGYHMVFFLGMDSSHKVIFLENHF
jgi:hypothetical protein